MGFGSIYWVKREKKKFKLLSKAARKRRRMPYKKFLKTKYWSEVRAKAIERDGGCKRCKTKDNLQVHHISYAYRGDELKHMTTVVTLCRSCHEIEHFGKPR